MKKFIVSFLLINLIIFTGCSNKNEELEQIDSENLKIDLTTEDLLETFDKNSSYIVEFNDNTANYTKGNLNNLVFNITEGGTYYLTGNFYGSILIDTKQSVRLIFDNLTVSSSNNSAIFIKNSEKTVITLANNSKNKLTDTSNYTLDSEEEPNATLFSKEDLTINGNGTLEIESYYNDALASKDGLKIVNGNLKINSVGDGIRGKDYIYIKNGNFDIKSQNDGIKTTNTDTNLGNLTIENGTFKIVSTEDGIDSENLVLIKNGNFNITTGGGSINSSTKSDWGNWGRFNEENSNINSTSSKGIKAGSNILIENANINIDSSDDSIHSNNLVEIKNGEFDITSGDDGIHSDTNLSIYGGNINITKSYEGLESSNINIYNGKIHVISIDDGINVAGGNDSSSINGRKGQNHMSTSSGKLEIEDGYIYVDSEGDGLDSNGSIYIKGGTVIVNGPQSSGNGVLDYDNEFVITGGTLIGAGSSEMMQTPSSNSKINTIAVVLDSFSDSPINITDSNNNQVITFKPSKKYNLFIYSSSNIKMGQTYNVNINGIIDGENEDGIYDGIYKNYTLLQTVSIDNVITNIGNNMKSHSKSDKPPIRC